MLSDWPLLSVTFSSPPDDGWLHRAVDIHGEMHIMEELQLFDKQEAIQSLTISSTLVFAAQSSLSPAPVVETSF